eukprot:747571-Hanusia_phi.AAC.1
MWQQARAKNSNTEARLLVFLDCPRAGKWVKVGDEKRGTAGGGGDQEDEEGRDAEMQSKCE